MKVLITGGAGMLGSALCRRRPSSVTVEVTIHTSVGDGSLDGVKKNRVDLTQPLAFLDVLERRRPDLVVHTAYVKTDHSATLDMATEVAAACAAAEVDLIHMSTDAVFDGENAPYSELSKPDPVHAYGHAKLLCEAAIASSVPSATIVRTSLVIATDGSDGTSAWVIDSIRKHKRVQLFSDEIRTPILVDDLADQIWEIITLPAENRSGIWHLPGPERLSRAELGVILCESFDLDSSLIDEVQSPIDDDPRPRDSSLSSQRSQQLSVQPRRLGSVMGHGHSL